MKFLIIFAIFIAVAVAKSPPRSYQPTTYKPSAQKVPVKSPTGDATILSRDFINDGYNYQFSFETSDGIMRNEVGEQKKIGEGSGVVMRGEYSYIGPNGNTYRVRFDLMRFYLIH